MILSGDQICKQDYADFLRFHKEKGAEFSVAVMEVDWKEASRFGLMVADENDRITEFQEKPPVPKSNLASMGIYIFNWDVLKKYLEEDEARSRVQERLWHEHHPRSAAGRPPDVCLPLCRLLAGCGHHRQPVGGQHGGAGPENSGIDIFDEKWKIYSRNPVLPAQKIGPRAVVQDSLITEGCKYSWHREALGAQRWCRGGGRCHR